MSSIQFKNSILLESDVNLLIKEKLERGIYHLDYAPIVIVMDGLEVCINEFAPYPDEDEAFSFKRKTYQEIVDSKDPIPTNKLKAKSFHILKKNIKNKMNKDPNKIKKSQEQRLTSLKQKANEYKINKSLIRDQLSDKKINQNSKKVFSDSDDSGDEKVVVTQNTNKFAQNNLKTVSQAKNKSFSLFGDDNDDDGDNKNNNKLIINGKKLDKLSKKTKLNHNSEDDDDDDSENETDLFDKKLNLDENKTNKLIYLKTKFSNDNRFKIDERFLESESENEDEKKDEDDKNEFEQEKENALRILEEITGKPIKKIHEKEANANKAEKSVSKMIRYDPTKEEHKIFEVNKDKESEVISDDKAAKTSEKKKDKKIIENGDTNSQDEAETEDSVAKEDPTRFYEIRDDIKNLFCKNEVFQFKFSNQQANSSDDEVVNEEENERNSDDEKNFKNFNQIRKSLDYSNTNNYESSLSSSASEDEYEDHKSKTKTTNEKSANDYKNRINILNDNLEFIPDLKETKLQEALKFFQRQKSLDELREEWSKEREILVEDYKKKHKKAKRVQRHKDEEKLFVWKKTAFQQKTFKKHKK